MQAHPSHNIDFRDQRAEPRGRTLKRGLIVFHNGSSVFDCTVQNLSLGGAKLLFGESAGVPNHFDLAIRPSRDRRPCTVRWRNEYSLGVSFDALH